MAKGIKTLVPIIAGASIFAGIPLLAWGIGTLGSFFSHPARTSYIAIIVLLQFVSVIYNPISAKEKQSPKKGIAQSKFDLVLIQILSLAIVFIAPHSDSHSLGKAYLADIVRYLGLVFLVTGFIMMQVAENYLGRQFSVKVTIQQDHKLIRNGPYRYVRHPRYLGITIMFSGISLVFSSYLALGIVFVLTMVFTWRIVKEESLMRQEFGEEWDNYCTKSWRLLPFVF